MKRARLDETGQMEFYDVPDSEATEYERFSAPIEMRAQRDKLLVKSDWTDSAGGRLTPEQHEAWLAYRKALRDVPLQEGFPFNVIWPEPPGTVP